MSTHIVRVVQVLLVFGLPALALIGIGVSVLRREPNSVVRGIGYLIVALGGVLGIVTLTTILFGVVGITEGVRALM